MMSVEPRTKPKRIWHWALAAGWIAAIFAVLGSIGAYTHAPAPDGTREAARDLLAYVVGFSAGSAILASVIVWAVFFFAVFFRRASIIKCLAVLAIMIPASFALAAPLSFIALVGHNAARTEQIDTWNRETSQRVRLLYQTVDRQVMEAGDLSLRLQSKSEIDAAVERNQRVLAAYQNYENQLERELNVAKQQVANLDLTETERQALLDQSEQRIFAALRSDAADNVAAARHRVEMATLLQREQAKWAIQDGHIAFYDTEFMQRMQAMGAEYDAIVARINARRPTPAGSAPPPQQ